MDNFYNDKTSLIRSKRIDLDNGHDYVPIVDIKLACLNKQQKKSACFLEKINK